MGALAGRGGGAVLSQVVRNNAVQQRTVRTREITHTTTTYLEFTEMAYILRMIDNTSYLHRL